jgi:hypothetical protein
MQSAGCGVINFPITGKKTGNFFERTRKLAWIAGFRDTHVQKQGINREFYEKARMFQS